MPRTRPGNTKGMLASWSMTQPPFALRTLSQAANMVSNDGTLAANTLLISVSAATVASLLTMLAAWLSVRRAKGGWVIDQLANIPLVFPGLVLGIAVMQLFLHVPIPIYGTLWILVWAFVISYLPYGMRYNTSGMLQ